MTHLKDYHFASDHYAVRAPLKPEVTPTVQLLSQLDKNRYKIPITEDDCVRRKWTFSMFEIENLNAF